MMLPEEAIDHCRSHAVTVGYLLIVQDDVQDGWRRRSGPPCAEVLFAAARIQERLLGWRYAYWVMLDDDVPFVRGGPREFERFLYAWEPAVGLPAMCARCGRATHALRRVAPRKPAVPRKPRTEERSASLLSETLAG